jgi:carboxyl-terminal processing protease
MEPTMANTYVKLGKKRIMLKTLRTLFISSAILILGMGIGFEARGLPWIASRINSQTGVSVPLQRDNLDFSQFWQVWDFLQRMYLDPSKIVTQKMIYGAIQGMTASLGDPYTMYLPPTENQQAKEDLSGGFDGVGIQLGYKQGTIAVQTPLDEHPAIKMGVKAGDLILKIKDEAKNVNKDTSGMSLTEAVSLIRGKKGTPVTLTFYREGKGQFTLTIIRDTIVVPSVEVVYGNENAKGWEKTDSGKVAWLKVRQFGDRTQPEWDSAVSSIISKRDQLKGIVLDLRNNPGGYLDAAVSLASEFIPEGKIVEQKGRIESKVYEVNKRGRLLGEPLVVLINGGSASASEILAGALRDRLGIELVGEQSFGKGTVQDAIDLPGKAGLHVTIAKWLLPSGDWIHEEGLKPDVKVTLPDTNAASQSAGLVDTQLSTAVGVLNGSIPKDTPAP